MYCTIFSRIWDLTHSMTPLSRDKQKCLQTLSNAPLGESYPHPRVLLEEVNPPTSNPGFIAEVNKEHS